MGKFLLKFLTEFQEKLNKSCRSPWIVFWGKSLENLRKNKFLDISRGIKFIQISLKKISGQILAGISGVLLRLRRLPWLFLGGVPERVIGKILFEFLEKLWRVICKSSWRNLCNSFFSSFYYLFIPFIALLYSRALRERSSFWLHFTVQILGITFLIHISTDRRFSSTSSTVEWRASGVFAVVPYQSNGVQLVSMWVGYLFLEFT